MTAPVRPVSSFTPNASAFSREAGTPPGARPAIGHSGVSAMAARNGVGHHVPLRQDPVAGGHRRRDRLNGRVNERQGGADRPRRLVRRRGERHPAGATIGASARWP